MTKPAWTDLKAIIVDPTGPELTEKERELFTREKPAGFILFKRNCVSQEQVKKLVADLRACVGRDDIPVLIDQEGGSVARLKEPAFKEYPAAKIFGQIHDASAEDGEDATRTNSRLMALDLIDLGVNVNCAPVADVPAPDCHQFLSGSRTYSEDADIVGTLGEAVCRGLLDGGVTPVIKHIPGHGRAKVDSHLSLPVVDASHAELSAIDFKPFKHLSSLDIGEALWAMAAHVVYENLDPNGTATVSKDITDRIVRKEIGFKGVLIADDISMKALGGTLEERVLNTLAADMDLTMLCNASFEERELALAVCPKVTDEAAKRIARAEQLRTAYTKPDNDNKAALETKLTGIIQKRKLG